MSLAHMTGAEPSLRFGPDKLCYSPRQLPYTSPTLKVCGHLVGGHWYTPGHLLSGLRPALAPSLNLYQYGEHHSPLSGDSLRSYLQNSYTPGVSDTEPNRQLAGRGRREPISG